MSTQPFKYVLDKTAIDLIWVGISLAKNSICVTDVHE